MNRRTVLILAVSIGAAAALGLVAGLALADELPSVATEVTAPTAVSYQGEVLVDGEPYTGTGYFKFAVVNPAGSYTYWSNDGTSSGGSEPANAVPLSVQDGLFSVLLGNTNLTNMTQPINAGVFADRPRRLHVWFGETPGGPFTDLGLTVIAAVPYALNSETLDGLDSDAFQQRVDHVIVVAKSGGDYTTINDALNSITDNGPDSRYLVWVAPGTYSETVRMKPYVHIRGAGAEATTISSTVSSSSSPTATATVVLTRHVVLRDVTVVVTGTGEYKTAILVQDVATDTAEIVDVEALADGGQHGYAIYNDHSSPVIRDISASGRGSGDFSSGHGIYNAYSSPTILNVTATGVASGTLGSSQGVYNWYSSPVIRDSVVQAEGSYSGFGISNYYSSMTILNTTSTGEGGTIGEGIHHNQSLSVIRGGRAQGTTKGVYVGTSSSVTIQNATVSGGDAGISMAPTYVCTATVDSSQLTGGTWAIDSGTASTVYAGGTLLDGGADADGTYHCVGAYDETYTALDGSCQ